MKSVQAVSMKCSMFGALGLALALNAAPVMAADAPVADAAPAVAAQGPDAELKAATDKVRALITQNHVEYKVDKDKFYGVVNDLIVPRFDVPFIAKRVLGVNYRNASADQRTRFADAFKNMLIRNYADALLDNYDSVKVDWQTPRMAAGVDDTVVNAGLTKNDGQKVTIGFRVHLVDGDWKIWDIVVENISLVTNYAPQINAEIKKSSLDDVIQRMQRGELVGVPKKQDAK